MELLNLTVGQLLGFGLAISGLLITLYLLANLKRRYRVSSLRFWNPGQQIELQNRYRKINQPLSLFLQLLACLLLLLAIAGWTIFPDDFQPRDHVLIVDTSAWTAASTTASRLLLDLVKEEARLYLRSLPGHDRVMMIQASGVPVPLTGFEPATAGALEEALGKLKPSFEALNLKQAFELASHCLTLLARRPGEITIVTPGYIREPAEDFSLQFPARVLTVPTEGLLNAGIQRVLVHEVPGEENLWEAEVRVKNYSAQPATFALVAEVSQMPLGVRQLPLGPQEERVERFRFRTSQTTRFRLWLEPGDGLKQDNFVDFELNLPLELKVAVFSKDPDALAPLLSSLPRTRVFYYQPSRFSASVDADLFVFDRCWPGVRPNRPAIWIKPPSEAALAIVSRSVEHTRSVDWNVHHPITRGVHSKDLFLTHVQLYAAARPEEAVAITEHGPLILAMEGPPKQVVFGFHPVGDVQEVDFTLPLLFANTLRWLTGDIFRRHSFVASSAGLILLEIDSQDLSKSNESRGSAPYRVLGPRKDLLPFSVHDKQLSFYAPEPGIYTVEGPDARFTVSAILPEVAAKQWAPPASFAQGLPVKRSKFLRPIELWKFLSLAAVGLLLLEWLLFGTSTRKRMPAEPRGNPALSARKEPVSLASRVSQ